MTWQQSGACVGKNPDLWFPDGLHDGALAKQVCRSCPVRLQCLDHGLHHEDHGVWGGLDQRELRRERRRRRIHLRLIQPSYLLTGGNRAV